MSHECEDHQCEATSKQLCVSKVPIFNHLQFEELLAIVKTSNSRTYEKGQLVFQAGGFLEALYIVHKGRVKVYRLTESGREQLVRFMEPGDFMGELSIFSDDVSMSYAEAVEKTEVCMIRKEDMKLLLMSKPPIGLKILEEFSKRLKETEKSVERLSSQDAEKRLASYLLELVEGQLGSDVNNADGWIVLPMRKKDLASYIGITQETLSRRFASFQEKGWIELSGQREIKVVDYDALSSVLD